MSALRVIAIISAYNEEDIIGQVIGDLIQQGIDVYLIETGTLVQMQVVPSLTRIKRGSWRSRKRGIWGT